MKYVPKNYQKRAIKNLLMHPHHGLFMQPGLGKTSTTLAAFKILKTKGFVDALLVVAPLSVCYNVWPHEVTKFSDFAHLRCRVLHGKTKTLEDAGDVDVFLINPEGLLWLTQQLVKLKRWPFDWLVVDESTRFKHTNTVRFKLIKNLLSRFTRRSILTGTPTPNGLLDLFGQIFLVDQGKALGRFITHYRNEFFYPSGYGGYEWTPQPDAEKRIIDRIRPITTTMLAKDWLDLPKQINSVVWVELPQAAKQAYRQFEQQLIAQLDRGKIVAANAAVATAKCRQVCNGGVYDEDGNVHELHEAKVDAVESLVEELAGAQLLVAHQFKHDRERLLKRFPKAVSIHGGLKPAQVSTLLAKWNTGEVPLLIAQAETIYHGLNLQLGGAHHLAWFGLTWDFEVYEQVIKRLLRQGQVADRVVVHHLLTVTPIEELMYQVVIEQKQADSRRVLEALKGSLSIRARR